MIGPEALAELPRASWGDVARNFVQNALRTDMRSSLERMHRRYGKRRDASRRPIDMVNLFGPDANRWCCSIATASSPRASRGWRSWGGSSERSPAARRREHKPPAQDHARGLQAETRWRSYAERMNPMIEAGIESWGGARKAFPSYKQLTLDIAGVDLRRRGSRSETQRMNGVFEDMVAASMSIVRLPIRGLEFKRGLDGRAFLARYFGELLPKKRADAGADMLSRSRAARTNRATGSPTRTSSTT